MKTKIKNCLLAFCLMCFSVILVACGETEIQGKTFKCDEGLQKLH